MNKIILTISISVCTVLAACICPKSHEGTVTADGAPMASPTHLGLALYEPRSDVAHLTSTVRHVLHSAKSSTTMAPSQAASGEPSATKTATVETSIANSPHHLPPIVEITEVDTVYAAWLKYCDSAQDLSMTEWALIDATNMPSDLQAIWSEECFPLK